MIFIDFTAVPCPVPLVKIKLVLKSMASGEQVHVLLTDAGSRQDIPSYLQKQGHKLEYLSNDVDKLSLVITKN